MNTSIIEAWRTWRASLRRPGFLLLAGAVLGLGIGAVAVVFTLIDSVLLKPLPYPQAHLLAAVGRLEDGHVRPLSPQLYQHLGQVDGVQSIGIYQGSSPPVNIAGHGAPEQVPSLRLDRGLLPTLGVIPALGRNFTAEEDAPYGPPAAMLSHGFWQRRFGGSPGAIGAMLDVEGVPHTIVGVLPASFNLDPGDVILPTAFAANSSDDGSNYAAVTRLLPGKSMATVSAMLNTHLQAYDDARGLRRAYRQTYGAEDLKTNENHEAATLLAMFGASALLVLLIAVVNLTNLMLLRTLARGHETSVRAALGASRWRLALPSLAESLLVGMVGGIGGLALAVAGLASLQAFLPAEWMAGRTIQLGIGIVTLALGSACLVSLCAVVIGLWRAGGLALDELREGGRSGIGRQSGRLGRVLVMAQVALATALLFAAGIFMHILADSAKVKLGFEAAGIETFDLAPVRATYADADAVQRLAKQLTDRLRLIPGATDATVTTNLPSGGFMQQFNTGNLHVPGGEDFGAQVRAVDEHFFGLFGIPIADGRGVDKGDIRGGEPVAMVNRSFADMTYGGHALGRTIQMGTPGAFGNGWSARIVGIVPDTFQFGPLGEVPPIIYMPLAQVPPDVLALFRTFEPIRFAISVRGDPDTYREAILRAVADVAPDQPIANIRSMQRIVHETTAEMRMELLMASLFAGLALLLAAVGIYAVMAVAVASREREFGVRAALGASPVRLVTLVLRSGLGQVLAGLVAGIALAVALYGVLRAVVDAAGLSVFDPIALLGVCIVLAVTGVVACLVPALRAGRMQPMRALRGE